MKKRSCSVVAIALGMAFATSTLRAADSFWDINGATPGAGGTAPAGPWDATTANWSADSTGSSPTAAWTPGDTAVFSAGNDATGAFTVTVSSTQTVAGVRVEEGTVTLSGGTLSLDVTGGGTMDVATGLIISSVITGGANNQTLTKTGTGSLVLSGANTYTGLTTVNGGVLRINNASGLGTTAGGTVVNSGAALEVGASLTAGEPVTLNGTGIANGGALRFKGAFTWNTTFTLGSSGVRINSDSGTARMDGAITSGGQNYDLIFGGSGSIRLNLGSINVAGGTITKDGTGTIQTEASWTAGALVVNDGGLAIRGGGPGATIPITFNSGADYFGNQTIFGAPGASFTQSSPITLNHAALPIGIRNATTFTLAGVISGPGGINLGNFGSGTAGGTLVLNNNNTYTGDTLINRGTLRLGAAGGVGGSTNIAVASGATFDVSGVAFTLGSGQTLRGSGTVTGNVTANGTIAPGASPGTLTLNNDLNLASSAVLSFELVGNNTTVGGGVNDLLVVGGNLTLDGTLNVTEIGAGSFLLANGGDTWRLINYNGTLTDNGLTLGTMPTLQSGLYFVVDTATPGQVNLMVVPEPSAAALGLICGLGLLVFIRRKR